MSRNAGQARLERIFELAFPLQGVVVDVGCDHGYIAKGLRERAPEGTLVVASERRGNRLPRYSPGVPTLVTDGLAGLARVDLAVIAGMGPHAILGILERGPQPTVAVVHSPDRTDTLRQGLKDAGWRITHERLAPEGRRFAEILRIERGHEPAEGHALWFGPRLLERDDDLRALHAAWTRAHWQRIAEKAPPESEGHRRALGWLRFLDHL